MSEFNSKYSQAIKQYRENQKRKIPEEWKVAPNLTRENNTDLVSSLLSPIEIEITESTTIHILEKIRTKEWTSLIVVKAFAHRSSIAQQLVNPLTEIFFEEAIARAKVLDNHLQTHGNVIGPLHGLPISIKDEFDLKSQRTTLGLISQIDSEPSTTTSPNIQILISQGAIPFVKTNVPTAAFNIETTNNLFGSTLNPYQPQFSAGGSSGGEAALIALRGSPLGVATDLGGSIRQPASFNGVYGMKPTSNRVPHWNEKIVVSGMESLNGTNGAISNDIDGLEIYFKSIIDTQPWLEDTKVIPLAWDNNVKINNKLKFGLLLDDGVIRVTPPVKRALIKVRDLLISKGHQVVEFDPPNGSIPQISSFAEKFMNSGGLKRLYEELIKTGEPIAHIESIKETNDLPVSELWKLQKERTSKVNEFWKYWKSLDIDVLISPVTALAGCKFGEFVDVSYSPLANVIDFPSVVFPVLKADKTIDSIEHEHQSYRNDIEKQVWDYYNPELSHGVPIGLQIIGPKYQEEKTLKIVRIVSELINYNTR